MRTFDSKKGKKTVDIVIKHGPIGFNELQRKIGFSSRRTLGLWLERLDVFDILDKDNQGKIVLTKAAKIELVKNGTIIIPEDSRKKKMKKKKIPIIFWDKKERIKRHRKRESAYVILVSKAAGGDYRYRPTLNSEYGNPSMFDIRTGKDQNYSGYHVPGVGLSDFKKTEGPAMLDRRLHVGHMELFAYIKDFTKSKIQQYINELKNLNDPVLKEITVSDYEFLSYVYDLVNDNPNLIILNREGHAMEEEKGKPKLRLIINQEEEEKDRLRFYHDITYYNINNHDNNNNIKINSKLIFDINNFFYNDNDNFSTAIWKEQRYIIANQLLREFINICWSILGLVFLRMGETYVYKIWPYEKVDIANSIAIKINRLNLSALYRKWYDKLFGHYRFTQHNFSQLLARKKNFKKLDKGTQKEQLEYAKNLVKSYDNGIKENYKIIMSEKYAAIRDKYKVVVKPLLDIVYPDFVKEIIAYH